MDRPIGNPNETVCGKRLIKAQAKAEAKRAEMMWKEENKRLRLEVKYLDKDGNLRSYKEASFEAWTLSTEEEKERRKLIGNII